MFFFITTAGCLQEPNDPTSQFERFKILEGESTSYTIETAFNSNPNLTTTYEDTLTWGLQSGTWVPLYLNIYAVLNDAAQHDDRFPNPLTRIWDATDQNPIIDGKTTYLFSGPQGATEWQETLRGVMYDFSLAQRHSYFYVQANSDTGLLLEIKYNPGRPWQPTLYAHYNEWGSVGLKLTMDDHAPYDPTSVSRILTPHVISQAQLLVDAPSQSYSQADPVPPTVDGLHLQYSILEVTCKKEQGEKLPLPVNEQHLQEKFTLGQTLKLEPREICHGQNGTSRIMGLWQLDPAQGDLITRLETGENHQGVVHIAHSHVVLEDAMHWYKSDCDCLKSEQEIMPQRSSRP